MEKGKDKKMKTEMMTDEKWIILAKKLNNEMLSEKETVVWEQMATDGEEQKILHQAATTLKKTDLFLKLQQYDTSRAWGKVSTSLSPKRSSRKIFLLRIAAVFLLLLAGTFAVWYMARNPAQQSLEWVTSVMEPTNHEVKLPDGTLVVLNRGSKLSCPRKFSGNERIVSLQGEAFFDVAPNREKPFVIETGRASIRVVGTTFNVSAYDDAETVEVMVKSGAVELVGASSEKVLLRPGQKGILHKNESMPQCENSFHPNSLAWYTHELVFDYTPLDEVIETLERAYPIRVEVGADVDLKKQINATFSRQDPGYILEVVALTFNLRFEKNEDQSYSLQNP